MLTYVCSRASDYGLMKIDKTGRTNHFAEKPKGQALKSMVLYVHTCILHRYSFVFLKFAKMTSQNNDDLQQVDTTVLGLSKQDALKNPYIASMGVYVFKTDVLLKLLKENYPSSNDFGSEIIPSAVKDYNVQVSISFIINFHI